MPSLRSLSALALLLGYLWMLWDTDKQTLADKIVHSTVIDVPKS